jgi:hypothetical protein
VVELVGSVITCPLPALTVGGVVATAAFTTTDTFALAVRLLLSVAVSVNTYVPATVNPDIAVLTVEGEAIDAAAGPEASFQLTVVMVAPLFPVADPDRFAELVGSVIVGALPALTVGATLPAALTVTVTVDELDAHPLSVTVRLYTYVPATRPDSRVD